ncbi:MAG: vWA domain-containing protein [Nannocystaceae bacterium]
MVDAAARARAHARENGKPNGLEAKRTVTLVPGRTQVKLPARVAAARRGRVRRGARYHRPSPGDNRTTGNDRAAVAGDVQGRLRVLLASTDGGGALASALRADHLDVESVGPGAVPQTDAELRPYDLVIFSDVAARSVPSAAQKAVASWVETQGGGASSWSAARTRSASAVGAAVRSSTCAGAVRRRASARAAQVGAGVGHRQERLDVERGPPRSRVEAARATASTLEPSDQLGVIAFDSRPHVLVRLQKASNRMRIAGDIRRLAAGGGTNALPALREAYLQLRAATPWSST